MKNQKQVKFVSFTADNLGILKAVELDFQRYKDNGVIAIKGGAGNGKSTIQNGIKASTQGRQALADAEQYGDEWETKTQLLDGEQKIFIKATKKKGVAPKFTLFEIDKNGKKVSSPVIDGEKATHKAYLEKLTTALTFGIKDFLSDNNTVQTKFMFDLFKDELSKLGVDELIRELSELTSKRDQLRAQCQHIGAFMERFEQEGYKKEDLDNMSMSDIEKMSTELQELLTEKARVEGSAQSVLERKKAAIQQKGNDVVSKIRDLSDSIKEDYQKDLDAHKAKVSEIFSKINALIEADKTEYQDQLTVHEAYKKSLSDFEGGIAAIDAEVLKLRNAGLLSASLLSEYSGLASALDEEKESLRLKVGEEPKPPILPIIEGNNITEAEGTADKYQYLFIELTQLQEPDKPNLPVFKNGRLTTANVENLSSDFTKLIEQRTALGVEFMSLTIDDVNTEEIDDKIQKQKDKIAVATERNKLIERYQVNREWVEYDARVVSKRDEIKALYSQVETGVEGLKFTPFYNKEEKMTIKTTYNGCADPDFFKNQEAKDQLLFSYSSTQRPLIAILLQVSLLKKKSKYLPYIFLDDVPLDSRSREFLARIAEQEGLFIITSVTGDFDRDKLKDNEMLIEGGEVFFQ